MPKIALTLITAVVANLPFAASLALTPGNAEASPRLSRAFPGGTPSRVPGPPPMRPAPPTIKPDFNGAAGGAQATRIHRGAPASVRPAFRDAASPPVKVNAPPARAIPAPPPNVRTAGQPLNITRGPMPR